MNCFRIHEDTTGAVTQLHPEADSKHVSDVRVDIGNLSFVGVSGCSLGNSSFPSLVTLISTGG